MELLLNAIWLLLALTSLAFWLRGKPDSGAGRPRRSAWLRGLGALSYALVLLFPVISLTDDLHDQVAVLEESRSSRGVLKSESDNHGSSHSSRLSASPATVPPRVVVGFRGQLAGWTSSLNLRPQSTLLAPSSKGRAPPLLS